MSQFNALMPHGRIEEVFPDVFFVMGTMRNVFFGSMWQFSRNMIVVRHDGELSLINAVRLDEEGLKALEALGTVKHVVKIGSMHGHDDAFYLDRYGAKMWALPGMPHDEGVSVDEEISADNLPFPATIFTFEQTKLPEAILFLDRGGETVAIACDALQNWTGPDEYMDAETIEKMEGFNFFTPANCGPAWMQVNEPKPGDFERLKKVSFQHALCGHGVPLRGDAQSQYHATFQRLYGV